MNIITNIKKGVITLFVISIVTTPLISETLNIYNDNANAVIKIENLDSKEITKYNTNVVSNAQVIPGFYRIEVKIKKDTIYSKIIEVKEGSSKTVNTNYKPATELKESLMNETIMADLIIKHKRSLGIGLSLGTIHGLSLKKNFGPIGIQVIGWSSNTSNQIAGNLRFNLVNKVYKDKIMFLFTGLGAGYESATPYAIFGDDDITEKLTMFEFILGVEHPNFKGFGYWTYAVTYELVSIDTDYGAYYYRMDENHTDNGMFFKCEYHYHF